MRSMTLRFLRGGMTGSVPRSFQPIPQRLAVVALFGDELGRRRQGLDAKPRRLAVMDVARRQQQDMRAAPGVADGMDLGVPATLGAADTMSQVPPFPPPPHSGGP